MTRNRPSSTLRPETTTRTAYDGTSLVFQLLRACGWGAFLNVGYFRLHDWVVNPVRLNIAQERLAKRSIKMLKMTEGLDVADIGVGRGRSSYFIAMANPTASVTGVDYLHENVAAAEFLHDNTKNLVYRQSEAEALPFESESMDRIHCLEAAFHFDRAAFLRECYRVLRPGGRAVIVDFMWKDPTRRAILNKPAGEIVREVWKFEDFWAVEEYLGEATKLGFRIAEQHDWSRQVTAAVQKRFTLITWAGNQKPLRKIACRLNPLLRQFTDDEWVTLYSQARAQDALQAETSYVALALEKPR
jgi:MPBQ/MSBQ methyltransferase